MSYPPGPSAAQRRPGLEPQRHLSMKSARSIGERHAQRRPGLEPQRHLCSKNTAPARSKSAQRRPGLEPQRHPPRRVNGLTDTVERSTKAGARTPATRLRPPRQRRRTAQRSTKAGARTPATHAGVDVIHRTNARAQRRPGLEPQRHPGPRGEGGPARAPLNEGRGSNPSDTPIVRGRAWPRGSSLNEGRGSNPSDTPRGGRCGPSCWRRSTKAGARTPATPCAGRHLDASRPLRSTKAGARTPATPSPMLWRKANAHSAQRRPGLEPQRHFASFVTSIRWNTLNEGRGSNPSDTARRSGVPAMRGTRSTKAGARTPATPCSASGWAGRFPTLNEGRGSNPSDTCGASVTYRTGPPAQRRPGLEPQRHPPETAYLPRFFARSTKAGARTPATPPIVQRRCESSRSLNEGRGSNPSDTWGSSSSARSSPALNEGRGSNPSDTHTI